MVESFVVTEIPWAWLTWLLEDWVWVCHWFGSFLVALAYLFGLPSIWTGMMAFPLPFFA
jgi:hypothetical protein